VLEVSSLVGVSDIKIFFEVDRTHFEIENGEC
jgi:hypothetical protein